MRSAARFRGTTLVELLVTLSILGILAGVTTLALRRVDRPASDDPLTILADSLRLAVDTPRAVVVRLVRDRKPLSATLWPDGSIVADSALRVDRLTGRPDSAR